MDISRVAFHLPQNKFHFACRLPVVVDTDDAGFLSKFSRSATPARPDAERMY